MNPHFMFNALNSIQNFILHDDEKNSLLYLSKFASLMRFTLDNSAETNITLQSELHSLQLYLELEKMRFKDKLIFSIDVAADINTRHVNVPALCIQPFVENAILHGLKHKKGVGHISIKVIKDSKNNIICIIEDDGVGRKKAIEYMNQKRPDHKSSGIRVTGERIELINTLYHTNMKLEITDLHDEYGIACGTRVTLTLPMLD
jgi:LytS/YehU family sensor histidine kinase